MQQAGLAACVQHEDGELATLDASLAESPWRPGLRHLCLALGEGDEHMAKATVHVGEADEVVKEALGERGAREAANTDGADEVPRRVCYGGALTSLRGGWRKLIAEGYGTTSDVPGGESRWSDGDLRWLDDKGKKVRRDGKHHCLCCLYEAPEVKYTTCFKTFTQQSLEQLLEPFRAVKS